MRNQRGFTLVELMIAMAIFSMAIVTITYSFVGLVRAQRIAAADRSTQQNARRAIEDIVRDVRASSGAEECTLNGQPAIYIMQNPAVMYYLKNEPGVGLRLFRGNTLESTCIADLKEIVAGTEVAVTDPGVFVKSFLGTVITNPGVKLTAVIKLEIQAVDQDPVTSLETVVSPRGTAPVEATP